MQPTRLRRVADAESRKKSRNRIIRVFFCVRVHIEVIMFMVGAILILVWPAFILPVILALIIRFAYRLDSDLHKLLAYLTFKPVIATPLWALIIVFLPGFPQALLAALISGVGLTSIIVWKCWRAVKINKILTMFLIGLDILRWGNTYFTMTSSLSWYRFVPLRDPYESAGYVLGLILPNAYAVIAFLLCIAYNRQGQRQNAKIQSESTDDSSMGGKLSNG